MLGICGGISRLRRCCTEIPGKTHGRAEHSLEHENNGDRKYQASVDSHVPRPK
jgi:hypothetical protein